MKIENHKKNRIMVEIQTILQKFNEKMILMLGLNENQ